VAEGSSRARALALFAWKGKQSSRATGSLTSPALLTAAGSCIDLWSQAAQLQSSHACICARDDVSSAVPAVVGDSDQLVIEQLVVD